MEIVNRNFQSQLHLSDHPVLNRIFAARGILKGEDLDLSLSTLLSPDEMPDVEVAANRLVSALYQNEKILVIGFQHQQMHHQGLKIQRLPHPFLSKH